MTQRCRRHAALRPRATTNPRRKHAGASHHAPVEMLATLHWHQLPRLHLRRRICSHVHPMHEPWSVSSSISTSVMVIRLGCIHSLDVEDGDSLESPPCLPCQPCSRLLPSLPPGRAPSCVPTCRCPRTYPVALVPFIFFFSQKRRSNGEPMDFNGMQGTGEPSESTGDTFPAVKTKKTSRS